MRRRYSGFTTVELLIAFAVVSIGVLAILNYQTANLRAKTFDETYSLAKGVLSFADSEKKRVTGTGVSATTGATTYTHAEIPTWTTVAAINAARATNATEVTPYGTAFEIIAQNGQIPRVRWTVPAGWPVPSSVRGGSVTAMPGGVSRFELMSIRSPTRTKRASLENYKRNLMLEESQ